MWSFHRIHCLKPLRDDRTTKGWWTINKKPGYLTLFPSVPSPKNWKDYWYVVVPTALGHPFRFTAPLRFRQPDPDMNRLPEITTGPHDRRILKGFSSEIPEKNHGS